MLVRVTSLLEFRLRKAGATLRTQIAPDLPPLVISPHALEQILINLLANALDAVAGVAHPVVQVRARVLAENPRFAVVEVADNGSGVAKTVRHRLFESFFTTKGEEQGTGLGPGGQPRDRPHLGRRSRAARRSRDLERAGRYGLPADAARLAGAVTTRRSAAIRLRGGVVHRVGRDDVAGAGGRRARARAPAPTTVALTPARPKLLLGTDARGRRHAGRPRARVPRRFAPVRALANVGTLEMPRAAGAPGHFSRALPAAARALSRRSRCWSSSWRAAPRRMHVARAHRAGGLDGRPVPHQPRRVGHDARRRSQLRSGRRRSAGARRDPDPGAARRARRHRARRRPQRRGARDRGRPAAGAVPARAGAGAADAGRRQLLGDRPARASSPTARPPIRPG